MLNNKKLENLRVQHPQIFKYSVGGALKDLLNPYMQSTGLASSKKKLSSSQQEAINNFLQQDYGSAKKAEIDQLRNSISFEGPSQEELDNLETDFKDSINSPQTESSLGLFSNMGNVLKMGFNNLANNQALQSQVFGLANTLIDPVENNSGTNTAFAIGDQVSNMLPGKAGLIAKGAMLGLKAINSIGGKRSDSFSINQDTLEQVGSSYGGSVSDLNNAAAKAGKKYGLFSSGSRRRANREIAEAKRQQRIMTNIAEEAETYQNMAGNEALYAGYAMDMSGGYDQRYMRAAKYGMKLQDKINLIRSRNFLKGSIDLDSKTIIWEPVISTFQEGGSLKAPWEPIISYQKGGKTRTLEELIAYAKEKNPRFIQRMSEPLRYVKINFKDDEGKDGWNHATHMMTFKDNIVYPMVQESPGGQLFILEDSEKALAQAELNGNVLKFNSSEEAEDFVRNYKQGWKDFFDKSPIDINPDSEYEEYEKNKFKLLDSKAESFKTGGTIKDSLEYPEIEETTQKNVIPEGALHKNKHHMEHAEGLTKKGIPVIDEDGDQQAEIELNEIIFTLEVTKKLEELYKKYYSEEHSQKEKDEFAIDAGKLLVKEILFNTEDRTGLISKCEKGGILNEVS